MSIRRKIRQPSTAKLRILHVLEATLGGTLRYLSDIIDASDSSLYTYAIAYATERADPGLEGTLERARLAGWETFRIEMVRAITPHKDIRSVIELRTVISEFSPTILHCHSSKAGAIGRLGRLISRNYPKVVYSPHAIAANMGRQYLLIEKLLAPFTSRYSAVSESEQNELVQLGLCNSSLVDIVYPTIDTMHFEVQSRQSARSLLSLRPDADIVLGVGRLVKQKNPLLFLTIVKEIASRRPHVRAIWVGEGEMRPEVEAAISTMGLSDIVTLAGWQPDVRPYIAASNVLLSCSCYESFGYMVAEALAMRRPVVASDVTGTRDIMSGPLAKGLYAVDDFTQATGLILGLFDDPAKAENFGVLGRQEMELHFSREAMRCALGTLYTKAIRS